MKHEETIYRKNKNTYNYYTKKFNNYKVPSKFKSYIYDTLNLEQSEARAFTHLFADKWAYKHLEPIYSSQFQAIIGFPFNQGIKFYLHGKLSLALHKAGITLHIDDYQFTDDQAFPYRLRLEFKDGKVLNLLKSLLNDKTDVLVHLTNMPTDFTTKTNKKTRSDKAPMEENEPMTQLIPNTKLQLMIDYLHSRRTKMAITKLMKDNLTDDEREILDTDICYHAVFKSDRIYTNGHVLNNYDLRQKLFDKCIHIDINSAHLSIIAYKWNLPILKQILLELNTSNTKIWKFLANELDIPYNDENKDCLKTFIYSMVYGMEEENLIKQINDNKEIEIPIDTDKLIHLPVIQEILTARDEILEKIKREEVKLISAFGEPLKFTGRKTAGNSKKLLSTYIQSIEQFIMYNAFTKVIQSNPNIVMVGYLHDGMWIKSTDNKQYFSKYANDIVSEIVKLAKNDGILLNCSLEIVNIDN